MRRYTKVAAVSGIAWAIGMAGAGAASANVSGTNVVNGFTGSLCLDAENNASDNPGNNGDPVQLYTCNGQSNQSWNFNENVGAYGTITNGDGGKCLDAENNASHSAGSDGDVVQLYTCNGLRNQQWEPVLEEDVDGTFYYILVNEYAGLLLDAENNASHSAGSSGDVVQLYANNGNTDELWNY